MSTKTSEKKGSKKKKVQKTLVLFDAHAILHRAYHALPDFATSKGLPTGALYGLSTMLMKIIGELKPDYIAACYDLAGPTYRHEAYDGYKAQRKKTDEALISQMDRSQDIFTAFGIPIYAMPGFEADDMLGTIVEQLKNNKDINIVIASGDMDTLQLVQGEKVTVYTLRKGLSDTILYDEEKVMERFGFSPTLLPDYKGLRGDPSDNIIGIKGIGEKTATTLISTFGTIESMYKTLKKDESKLKDVGLSPRQIGLIRDGEEEAEFSKMLATIRRDAPISFKIPEKEWISDISIEKAEALFSELEFRNLGTRLRELLRTNGKDISLESSVPNNEGLFATVDESATEDEIQETALMLWVLRSDMTSPTVADILEYSKKKTVREAREVIEKELRAQGTWNIFAEIEKPLIPVVRRMKERGIKIDTLYLKELSKTYHKELNFREKKIWKETGVEFNINSPKQLGEVLFDTLGLTLKHQKKTAGGARSTQESVLEKMKEMHPAIPLILEYREFQKLLSTYIDSIPTLVDQDNRLHADILQAGTTTGRMSSANPNVQNIPIKTELGRAIRNGFIAEKGFKLVAFDYSQIELRIAAILSGDEKLLDTFRKGEDIHTAVASYMFNIPLADVDKERRRYAKTINFGILYGMGVNALKEGLGTSRTEAQEFYNSYFRTFEGLTEYIENAKKETAKKGYTETLFGRRRYIEGINSRIPYVRAAAERMAVNAPMQGTSADIIKIAMKRIDDLIVKKGLGKRAYLLLQVHDELIYEIEESVVHDLGPLIQEIMESVLTGEKSRGVVCKTNIAVGDTWGSLQDVQ